MIAVIGMQMKNSLEEIEEINFSATSSSSSTSICYNLCNVYRVNALYNFILQIIFSK